MQIIVRDILKVYFPIQHQFINQFNNLSEEEKTNIINEQNKQIQQNVIKQINKKKLSSIENTKQINVINENIQQIQVKQMINKKLQNIKQFIANHRFFNQSKSELINQCIEELKKKLFFYQKQILKRNLSNIKISQKNSKSNKFQNISISQNLYKLSLYLNKDTNKQIFSVYQYILQSPNGISYQILAKRLKTDIINISHYCCKLKKMRFVQWQHKKQGIIVYPKINQKKDHKKIQMNQIQLSQEFNYKNSFIFSELSLNQNIMVNIASASSLIRNGLTNQQIKFKIMKHAQNKMVRRTVQGMKNIQKNAQRQGKVFEFKYKKQTKQIIKELDKKRMQNSQIVSLSENCKKYLNKNFKQLSQEPGKHDQQLLLDIINNKLTEYYSSIGIKQAKRQCTPLKLNRYIHVLNYLQFQGPDSQSELRRYIVQIQKKTDNNSNGIIHKRSMIGILEGLKKIKLIQEIDDILYPKWIQGLERKTKTKKTSLMYDQIQLNEFPRKKIKAQKQTHLNYQQNDKSLKRIPSQKIRMITQKEHSIQIFTSLLAITLQKSIRRIYRKGFQRILYVNRKKQSVQMFIPQKNIFYLLDNPFSETKTKNISENSKNLKSFMEQIDNFIQCQGKIIENIPENIQYQIIKYVRKNPSKNSNNLRSKYGKNWIEKFQDLQAQGIIKLNEEGYQTLQSFSGYLV